MLQAPLKNICCQCNFERADCLVRQYSLKNPPNKNHSMNMGLYFHTELAKKYKEVRRTACTAIFRNHAECDQSNCKLNKERDISERIQLTLCLHQQCIPCSSFAKSCLYPPRKHQTATFSRYTAISHGSQCFNTSKTKRLVPKQRSNVGHAQKDSFWQVVRDSPRKIMKDNKSNTTVTQNVKEK